LHYICAIPFPLTLVLVEAALLVAIGAVAVRQLARLEQAPFLLPFQLDPIARKLMPFSAVLPLI
jgi:hypothetical protein